MAGFEVLRVAPYRQQRRRELLDWRARSTPREGDRADGFAMPLVGAGCWGRRHRQRGSRSCIRATSSRPRGAGASASCNVAQGAPGARSRRIPDVPEPDALRLRGAGRAVRFAARVRAGACSHVRGWRARVARRPWWRRGRRCAPSFQPSIQPLMVTEPRPHRHDLVDEDARSAPEHRRSRRVPIRELDGQVLGAHASRCCRTRPTRPSPHAPTVSIVDPSPRRAQPVLTPRRVARHEPAAATGSRGDYVERLAGFFQQTIDDWYSTVARTQGTETPLYFAEKQMWRLSCLAAADLGALSKCEGDLPRARLS